VTPKGSDEVTSKVNVASVAVVSSSGWLVILVVGAVQSSVGIGWLSQARPA
jgi:hypothetical protein